MGMPAGLYAFLLARIALQLAQGAFLAPRVGKLAAWIATLLGMTGAGVSSQIGASFNDIAFNCCVLLGLWLLMREAALPAPRLRARWPWLVLAGLACGAAVGLKLVNALYAIPLGIAVLALFGLGPAVAVGAGMAGGFLLTWLPFALMLQREFGSPFFPFYNQIFRAPDFPPIGLADERFRPRGLLQALFYPFYWLRPSEISTEMPMMDARPAIGYAAVLALLVLVFRRGFDREVLRRERPLLLVLVMVIGAYALWARMFGIYRYLLVIESLSGVLAMVAIGRLVQRPRLVGVALFCGLSVAAMVHTLRPDWGHVAHHAPIFRFDPAPPVPAGSMLLLAGWHPLSYVVPFLPADVRAVGLYNNILAERPAEEYGLLRRVREAVAAHPGPFRLLTDPSENPDRLRAVLSRHGLALGGCTLVRTSMDPAGLTFCEVRRGGG